MDHYEAERQAALVALATRSRRGMLDPRGGPGMASMNITLPDEDKAFVE
ncbi:hypothetical protein [Tautonia marina]|nr:hypothetical protein [Tautonia marina]